MISTHSPFPAVSIDATRISSDLKNVTIWGDDLSKNSALYSAHFVLYCISLASIFIFKFQFFLNSTLKCFTYIVQLTQHSQTAFHLAIILSTS